MGFGADEQMAVRLPVLTDESDLTADTVIRERRPFADIPVEALVELNTPEPRGAELIPTMPLDYTFRVNTSEPVRLDTAAVIGRNPALPRIMQGRLPRLIRVPSPLKEVSNTHVELRQQGTLVIVTDLRTTNGSVVSVPGRHRVKLRQGESLVVTPGTIIEIGDGNVIEILSLQRAQLTERALG